MGMILRIASSRIVGQGDIVGRSGYFSLNLSANSVMRGRLDARRTLKSLVADLRLYLKTNVTLTISFATAKGSKNFTERAFFRNCFDYFTSNDIVFRLPWSSISVRRCLPGEAEKLIWWWSVVSPAYVSSRCQ